MAKENYQSPLDTADAVIANGASLSPAIDLSGTVIVGFVMPASWTAAVLTFQVSDDNVTFNDLYNESGTEISLTVAAARFVRLNPAEWAAIRYLKVRSGTTGSPVNQGPERTIKLAVRPV